MKFISVGFAFVLVSLNGVVLGQTQCSSNNDCEANEFCSEGSCREFGTCETLNDCRNPSNIFPAVACVGVLSCFDNGQCGIECGGSFCPPDEEEVECSQNPCEVDTCNEPYESCVSSNCGGCNSHFFDAAGNEVCTNSVDEENSCSSNADCQEGDYCSEGLCREFGTCGQVNDCRNPANIYPAVMCVGALNCFDDGRCGIQCGEPVCPPDEEEVQCPQNPCEVDTCDEPYESCVASTCGGCNSHFFDAAGNEVCTESTDMGSSCASNNDCQESEYCSEGLCRELGTCGKLNDCRNPANIYPAVMCIGALNCFDDGRCGIECGEPACPPDEEEVLCPQNPCEVDTCDEPHESCVVSNCGGCNSHFFDAAGNEVCTETTEMESTCSSNDDCQESEYCSEGLCRELGTCGQLNDCRNPSNLYPAVMCIGALNCFDDGRCGIQCGEPVCPPDEEEVECSQNPCEVNTCDEPYESCVMSNCGGCNSHFFDAAGNEVCTESTDMGSSCSSNDDCQESEYCSEGMCRELGTCGQLNDCRNPANKFPTPRCVGALTCFEDGRCGIECGEQVCPSGEEDFECAYNPCEVNICNEPHESCAMSTCGGCNSHFFDAAGNEVCIIHPVEELGVVPHGETSQAPDSGNSDDASQDAVVDSAEQPSQDMDSPPESITDLVGSSGCYCNPSNMLIQVAVAGVVLVSLGILF